MHVPHNSMLQQEVVLRLWTSHTHGQTTGCVDLTHVEDMIMLFLCIARSRPVNVKDRPTSASGRSISMPV